MSFVTSEIWSSTQYMSSTEHWNHIVLLDDAPLSAQPKTKKKSKSAPQAAPSELSIPGSYKVAVSSLEGALHIFSEKSHILSKQLKQPILQMQSGKFISALKHSVLALLHPHQIEICYLENDQLVTAFQHSLSEATYSMCSYGQRIFVQSMYNTISLIERESLVFSRLLSEERIMLPSEIAYTPTRDLIVTANHSSRRVCAFKVSKLASVTEAIQNTKNNTTFLGQVAAKPIMDWQWMLPDAGGSLQIHSSGDALFILTKSHLTKVNDTGVPVFMVRTSTRITCSTLASSPTIENMILLDRRGAFQVLNLKQFKYQWNGQYKGDGGSSAPVNLTVAPDGKLYALEPDGRVGVHILGSLKIHTNPHQEQAANESESFAQIQDKLKLAYKSIQNNVKKVDTVALPSQSSIPAVEDGPTALSISHKLKKSGQHELALTVSSTQPGKFRVKLNPPLQCKVMVEKEKEARFKIECAPNQQAKLSTNVLDVVVSFMYDEASTDENAPKAKSVHIQKIEIPPELGFAMIFQLVEPEEIVQLPAKLTLSHGLKDIPNLGQIPHQQMLEFECHANKDYRLQVISAKSGSNRTRLQLSNLSALPLVLKGGRKLDIEGHIPVEQFAQAWKRCLKFDRRFKRAQEELKGVGEVVSKLQQEVIRLTKEAGNVTDDEGLGFSDQTGMEAMDKAYEILDNAINDMSDGIEHLSRLKLDLDSAVEDVYASLWIFAYFTSNTDLLPSGNSFTDLEEWRDFLSDILFCDDEAGDVDSLDTATILEKLHSYFDSRGFTTKKPKSKNRRSKEATKPQSKKSNLSIMEHSEPSPSRPTESLLLTSTPAPNFNPNQVHRGPLFVNDDVNDLISD